MNDAGLLRVSMIQSPVAGEDIDENLDYYGRLLGRLKGKTDLAVLPELCTTGLSLHPKDLAESNDGKTMTAMRKFAADYHLAVTGSFIASEQGRFYNRAFFQMPDGQAFFYDKRHLFRMADEDKYFSSGSKRLIVDYLGWKICLMVCYDLRFPVWSRNTDNAYDLLIYVANWAEARREVWKVLLQARALENMCFVCGVNRIGVDAQDCNYSGDSLIFSPKGEKLFETRENEESIVTGMLHREDLERIRTKFPVWKDADRFDLKI